MTVVKAIEFGVCHTIYGCVGLTAPEVYERLSKQKGIISLVLEGSQSLSLCDVAIVDTVATFLACKTYFNDQVIAIVCDSSIALSSLKNLTPYDFEGNLFNNFKLKEPPRTVSLSAKSNHVKIERADEDKILEAVKDIISVSVLQEFNTITARMNSHARNQLRIKLIALIHGQTSVSDITNFITGLGLDADKFSRSLNSKAFTALKQAVIYYRKGHSLDYVMNQFGVKDQFEIIYLTKMIQEGK